MNVTCKTCGKPWDNRPPLAVPGGADGKRTWVKPPDPDKWWTPNCRHGDPVVLDDEGNEVGATS